METFTLKAPVNNIPSLLSDHRINHDPTMLKKLLAAVEQSPSIVIIADATGKIEYVNSKYLKISGYGYDEIVGKHMRQMSTVYMREDKISEIIVSLLSGTEWSGEFRNKKKNGEFYWVSTHISPLRDEHGNITHFIDVEEIITERKLAEEHIRASLSEKEVLLKEIHHRVKNNLQIICSLLSLQSAYIKDSHDLEVFRECQDRVRSMAMIHEMMYISRDLAHVDMEHYIRRLLDYLLVSYAPRHRITATVRTECDVHLNANLAVPCGLILNELITNSIKYAFTGCECGEISVEMGKHGNSIRLMVSDNGIGLPQGFDPASATTLGMQLVSDLSMQIGGRIHIDRTPGTRFCIEFPDK